MIAPVCECRGKQTQGVRCLNHSARWVGACEAVLCDLCAGTRRCCACGAPAAGHYRRLEVEAPVS